MSPTTALTTYCPTCDDRTVHNVVRAGGRPGRHVKCRRCTDVAEGLETGKYELAT